VVGAIAAPRGGERLFERLFIEGFALMRERLGTYALIALLCAASAATASSRGSLLQVFAAGNPAVVFRTAPINAVLIAALIAIFFVLPSALRKLEPSFRMTFWRGVLTFAMLLCLGLATDLGSARDLLVAVTDAIRGSVHMTRSHFITTLGVCALSLVILGVPWVMGLIGLLVLDALDGRSLILTAPGLFLLFVYCECVRYVLIVRWYGRLAGPKLGVSQAA